jgi:hypothetical protein
MWRFLKTLYYSGGSKPLLVEAFFCCTSIKLPSKVTTPTGGKIHVVNVSVDIYYTVQDGQITLRQVRLSRRGPTIMGSKRVFNVAATNRGEAWYAARLCSESKLREAVQGDLAMKDSPLRRIMMGKWWSANRSSIAAELAIAINRRATNEIARLVANGGVGAQLEFTYTKANGVVSRKRVYVNGLASGKLRARQTTCQHDKSFLIDRISEARSAHD